MATEFKLIEGINPKCSNEDYHNDREYLSSSGLKLILKDPKKFYETYIEDKEAEDSNKDAFAIGTYLHLLILEPHLVNEEIAVYEGKTRRGNDWDVFQEENEGKTIITASQKALCDGLYENYKKTLLKLNDRKVEASSFFIKGEAEETICTELRGVKVKIRTDYRRHDKKYHSIVDVKSTGELIGTREQAEAVVEQWDYDLSAALYCDVVSKVTGSFPDFFFCFLSKKNGECKIYKASEAMLERGRAKYNAALDRIIEARETGIYYENKVEELR